MMVFTLVSGETYERTGHGECFDYRWQLSYQSLQYSPWTYWIFNGTLVNKVDAQYTLKYKYILNNYVKMCIV
jgi:hypothetical protein